MIHLPNGIWPFSFAPMNEFKGFAVSLTSLMCQHHQIGGQTTNDVINDGIAGDWLPELPSERACLAIQCCQWAEGVSAGRDLR